MKNAGKKENITLTLGEGTYINTGTITWSNTNIVLTIDGNGQTINGNKNQVFYVNSHTSLILKNLIITNASSSKGGAIRTQGTLIIINSTLTNNAGDYGGGAIENYGIFTVIDSTFENNTANNGGAIRNNKLREYTIANSTFINNHAKDGGAIESPGYLNLRGNKFINNTADNNETIDYKIESFNGRFKDNVYESTSIAFRTNKLCIKDQRNLFHAGEEVVLNYSIELSHPNYYDPDIMERLDDITIYVNGEEYAKTKYENYTLSNLKGGEYEVYYTTCNMKSNTVKFAVININNWQELSDAVNIAKNSTEDLTIKLNEGTYINSGTITWNNYNMVLTIDGNGQTIDGNQLQVFNIDGRGSMLLKNITIQNANSNYGGAIDNSGKLTIINSTLTNNTAKNGGAIENLGQLTIINSTLTNNTAKNGGAIRNNAHLNITKSLLTSNSAKEDGGAIDNHGKLTITQSTLANNTVKWNGAAIFTYGNANITGNTFINNTADYNETIDMYSRKGYVDNNTYESTDIAFRTMTLTIKDNQKNIHSL